MWSTTNVQVFTKNEQGEGALAAVKHLNQPQMPRQREINLFSISIAGCTPTRLLLRHALVSVGVQRGGAVFLAVRQWRNRPAARKTLLSEEFIAPHA